MTVKIIECEQGSETWYRARMAMPTASELSTVLCAKDDQRSRDARLRYMYKLAGERLTGELMTSFSNSYMERGKAWEPEAREAYSLVTGRQVEQVGFIINSDLGAGASPDGLIAKTRMLEIKTSEPHILIAAWKKNEFPGEHKAQCQGGLLVAERDKIDIAVYCKKMPIFIKDAGRDEPYIKRLADAIHRFNDELVEVVEFMKRNGAEEHLAKAA